MIDQLTVSFWLDSNANTNLDPRVIEKLYDWDVKLSGSNPFPQFTSDGGGYATLNYSLPLNTWHHIVFTFNLGAVQGYVDGARWRLREIHLRPEFLLNGRLNCSSGPILR